MARKLIEYKIVDAQTVSYSNYNSSKTVLGPMMYKFTGSSVNDYYMGPPGLAWNNISQDTGLSGFGLPSIINYNDDLDLIMTPWSWNTNSVYRLAGYFFNKKLSTYQYLGLINVPTHNSTATVWGFPRGTIDYYTAGTVSVNGAVVSGDSTFWGANQITAGSRIGFGSRNPNEITNWYEINGVPLETNRFNSYVSAILVDSLNRVYVGGNFTTYNFLGSAYTATRLIRLNPDGSPDFTFNTGSGVGGTGGLNGIVRRIKFDPLDSTKLYIAGDFTTYSGLTAGYLTKLNTSNGSIDSQWDTRNILGSSTGFNNLIYDMDVDSNGRILVTGVFTSYVRSGTTTTVTRLCRLLPNGILDTTFSGYTTGLVRTDSPGGTIPQCLAIEPNTDKVYVGGLFNQWGGVTFIGVPTSFYNIIRLNTNGTIDFSYTATTTQFNDNPYTILPDRFGSGIYVGGNFTTYSGQSNNKFIKITSGGTKDFSFDNTTLNGFSSAAGYVIKAKLTNDNKLFLNGSLSSYRGSTIYNLIKLQPNGTVDNSFIPETSTVGLTWLNAATLFGSAGGDTIDIDTLNGDVYVGMTSTNTIFGGMIAYVSGGTIEENFYGKNLQRLDLRTSAPNFSAGTPYVIEDFRIYFGRANGTNNIGGLYSIKGIKITDFVTGTTQISQTTSGYYGVTARSSYLLPHAVNSTNPYVYIYDINLDTKTSWNSQIGYATYYPNLAYLSFDLRKRYRISNTGNYVYPDGFNFFTSGVDGSNVSPQNTVLVTTLSGSAAGVKSLYTVRPTVIRQFPITNLRQSVDPSTLVGYQFMSEIPPGNTTTYPASSSLINLTYMSEIDRFIITTAAAPFKSYITSFNSNLVTPSLTSTFWSRDTYNSLSYANSFERTFLVDGRQLQGTLSDTRAPKYPDAQGTYFTIASNAGWLHMVRQVASTENLIYAVPIGADEQYVSTSNNVIITPKYVIPNLISITGFYLNTLKEIGSSVFSQSPEPIFTDFRTTGIDDNTGVWTNFKNIDELNGLLCNNTTNNVTIQFRFRFRVAGVNCNPNKLYGFSFTYEDDTTDSHYLPSVSKSSLSNRTFAWQQVSLFNSNIPNMKVRVYNANTGDIILYDTVTDSNLGTWQYSTDGNTWNAWSSSADVVGNYIRYTANYLPSNYKLRVGLNQV